MTENDPADSPERSQSGPGGGEPIDLDLSPHWSLESGVTYLNHGAFGACPKRIQHRHREWLDQLESQPVRFFGRELPGLIDRARAELAEFVGSDHRNLAFVTNTTEGISAVLRSLDPGPGDELLITDHTYGACKNAVDFVAQQTGATVTVATLPFPVDDQQNVVAAILDCVTDDTRLALVDHITAFSGLVLPIADIVRALEERGIDTLVDGAHAPGTVDLELDDLDATYYVGNCHKWLCAPRGAAFLRVDDAHLNSVRPLAISHGAGLEDPERSRFHLEFDWTGTRDPSPWLCVPEVIQFLASLVPDGWAGIRRRNRTIAIDARELLCETVDARRLCPDSMIGFTAAIELPKDGVELPSSPMETDPLQDVLYSKYGIEVPIFAILEPRRRLLRISAHLYNQPGDYERLADALDVELNGS